MHKDVVAVTLGWLAQLLCLLLRRFAFAFIDS